MRDFGRGMLLILALHVVSVHLVLAAGSHDDQNTSSSVEMMNHIIEYDNELRPPFDHLYDLIEAEADLYPVHSSLVPYGCSWSPDFEKKPVLMERYAQSMHRYYVSWSKWIVSYRLPDGNSEDRFCVILDDQNHAHGFDGGQDLTLEEAIVLEASSNFPFDNDLGTPDDPDFCIDSIPPNPDDKNESLILWTASGHALGAVTDCPTESNASGKLHTLYLQEVPTGWPQRYALRSDATGRDSDGSVYSAKCSALQLSEHTVLGAAHCLAGLHGQVLTHVEMSSLSLGTAPRIVERPREDVFIAPDFDIFGESSLGTSSAARDLAIARFREPLPVNNSLPRLLGDRSIHTASITAHGYPGLNCSTLPPNRAMCTGHASVTRTSVPAPQNSFVYDAFFNSDYRFFFPGMSGSAALLGGYASNPSANVLAVLSNLRAGRLYMASVPHNYAFLVGHAGWRPPTSVAIIVPRHFQRLSVLSPPLFRIQSSRGFGNAAAGAPVKYVWLSSRGHVLGEGVEVNVSGRLRAGAQEVWLAVLPDGVNFADFEEVDASSVLDASIDYRLRVVDVTGPWGRLEFTGFGVCVRDLATGRCDLGIRWTTSNASGVEVRDGEGSTVASGASGHSVLSFAGNSSAQTNLFDGTGRLLDRKSAQVVSPSGSISSRDPGCEVLPTVHNPNATSCEIRLDWTTQYAPDATVWRVGIDPPTAPTLVRTQASGVNVGDEVHQGHVVRYELRQKAHYSSGLLGSTAEVYAVRYADAYEFDDVAFRRGPTYNGTLTRNFHLGSDVDWVRIPSNSAVPAVQVSVTGATAQVRPRVTAHYICAGPTFPEPDHMGLLLAGFDMTAPGQSLQATIPVDTSACGAFFGANHGFAQLALEIRNVLATDCERASPPPAEPCASHAYNVEVATSSGGGLGPDTYEPDDELAWAWEMPEAQCFYGHPDFDPASLSNYPGYRVKQHTLHTNSDIDWTVGSITDRAPVSRPWHSQMYIENQSNTVSLLVEGWSASGSGTARPNNLQLQDDIFSRVVAPGEVFPLNCHLFCTPVEGEFLALSVRAETSVGAGNVSSYRIVKSVPFMCPP